MRWKYKKLFVSERFVQYSYSRESDDLDGIIQYNRITEEIVVLIPCAGDKESSYSQKKAIEHFYQVISEGFPESRYVACG